MEILGEGEDGPVTGVRVVRNRIEADASGRLRAVPTGEEEVIACGLVLRSIGYRGVPLAGIPFDERRGLIRNEGGRVIADEGGHATGEYVVGWVKRGPSGVIGTNKKDAADTVARILEDREAGRLNAPADPTTDQDWLVERCPDLVTWEGWQAIDEHESALGAPQNRPRVKLVRTGEMLDVARAPRARPSAGAAPSDAPAPAFGTPRSPGPKLQAGQVCTEVAVAPSPSVRTCLDGCLKSGVDGFTPAGVNADHPVGSDGFDAHAHRHRRPLAGLATAAPAHAAPLPAGISVALASTAAAAPPTSASPGRRPTATAAPGRSASSSSRSGRRSPPARSPCGAATSRRR